MKRERCALTLAAACVLLGTACTWRRLERENAIALRAADARVLEGCYDCLLQARATYAAIQDPVGAYFALVQA